MYEQLQVFSKYAKGSSAEALENDAISIQIDKKTRLQYYSGKAPSPKNLPNS